MNYQVEKLKFIVLGKAAVGKSSLTIRYFHDKFNEEYNPTLQDTFTKKYNCKGQEGILEILDTAGQEEYTVMQHHWIKEGQGFVLVYSIIDQDSFNDLDSMIQKIQNVLNKKNLPIIIVGNKNDLEQQRTVSKENVQKFIEITKENRGINLLHIECSAKSGFNCYNAFTDLLEYIIDQKNKKIQRKNQQNQQDKPCCMCQLF